MSREWAPGEVAVRTYFGKSKRSVLTRCPSDWHGDGPHWHHADGGWDALHDGDGPTYRPLVVTDPEDMGDVERVRDACWRGGTPEDWQEYLRSLVASKPAEPTGLGAVVEDAAGDRWLRFCPDPGQRDRKHVWVIEGQAFTARRTWGDVNAVRVLSEGVTE